MRAKVTVVWAALAVGTAVWLAAVMTSEVRAAGEMSGHQAPVGHRQPTAEDVQGKGEESADEAMKKMDEDLDRKVKSICRGC